MTTKRITVEEAMAAITACARNGKIDTLYTVRGGLRPEVFRVEMLGLFFGDGGGNLCAYQEGPFGYNLAVLSGYSITYFDVPMPVTNEAEEILHRYADVVINAMARRRDSSNPERHLREQAAMRAIHNYVTRTEVDGR